MRRACLLTAVMLCALFAEPPDPGPPTFGWSGSAAISSLSPRVLCRIEAPDGTYVRGETLRTATCREFYDEVQRQAVWGGWWPWVCWVLDPCSRRGLEGP